MAVSRTFTMSDLLENVFTESEPPHIALYLSGGSLYRFFAVGHFTDLSVEDLYLTEEKHEKLTLVPKKSKVAAAQPSRSGDGSSAVGTAGTPKKSEASSQSHHASFHPGLPPEVGSHLRPSVYKVERIGARKMVRASDGSHSGSVNRIQA